MESGISGMGSRVESGWKGMWRVEWIEVGRKENGV